MEHFAKTVLIEPLVVSVLVPNILLVGANYERNFSIFEAWMSSHLVQDFMDNLHASGVAAIDYEEDPVDIRVVEAPTFAVSSLCAQKV